MHKIKKYILPQSFDDVFRNVLMLCGLGFLVNTLFILVTYYFNLNNDVVKIVPIILALFLFIYMMAALLYILIKEIPQFIKDTKKLVNLFKSNKGKDNHTRSDNK